MSSPVVTITEGNTYTEAMVFSGQVRISVYGSTWTATVNVLISDDGGTTWKPVNDGYAANAEEVLDFDGRTLLKAGVATGDFTSGSVTVRLVAS
jgi:hypothetical protein